MIKSGTEAEGIKSGKEREKETGRVLLMELVDYHKNGLAAQRGLKIWGVKIGRYRSNTDNPNKLRGVPDTYDQNFRGFIDPTGPTPPLFQRYSKYVRSYGIPTGGLSGPYNGFTELRKASFLIPV